MATKCKTCIHSRNCINGKYCTIRRVYTEQHQPSECQNYKAR